MLVAAFLFSRFRLILKIFPGLKINYRKTIINYIFTIK